MISLHDGTILIGTTELRAGMPEMAREVKTKTVIITKKGKPIAVLEDFDEFQEKNKIIDELEDLILGRIAKERMGKAKSGDFLTQKQMEKKLKIRL